MKTRHLHAPQNSYIFVLLLETTHGGRKIEDSLAMTPFRGCLQLFEHGSNNTLLTYSCVLSSEDVNLLPSFDFISAIARIACFPSSKYYGTFWSTLIVEEESQILFS